MLRSADRSLGRSLGSGVCLEPAAGLTEAQIAANFNAGDEVNVSTQVLRPVCTS